jgi:uncharacterized protein YecT (DUF1311 family)
MGLLVFTGLGLSPSRLSAQPDHITDYAKTPTETPTPGTASIDESQTDCLDSARSVSQTCLCLEVSGAAWQSEMEKAMARLQSALTGTAAAGSLQQAQTDWLRYRDSQLACADSILASNPGAVGKICAIKTALIAARVRELNASAEATK